MPHVLHHFRWTHLWILLAIYLAFAAWTNAILNGESESDRRNNWVTAATVGSISGPFTGAIARHLQTCCWEFSLRLFPYCAAMLSVGLLFQLIPLPKFRGEQAVRLTLWCVGLFGWFAGIPVSFLHALG